MYKWTFVNWFHIMSRQNQLNLETTKTNFLPINSNISFKLLNLNLYYNFEETPHLTLNIKILKLVSWFENVLLRRRTFQRFIIILRRPT